MEVARYFPFADFDTYVYSSGMVFNQIGSRNRVIASPEIEVIDGIEVVFVDRLSPPGSWRLGAPPSEALRCSPMLQAWISGMIVLACSAVFIFRTWIIHHIGGFSIVAGFLVAVILGGLTIRQKTMFRTWIKKSAKVNRIEIREIRNLTDETSRTRGDYHWHVRVECQLGAESPMVIPDDSGRWFLSKRMACDAIFTSIREGCVSLLVHPQDFRRCAINWKANKTIQPKKTESTAT